MTDGVNVIVNGEPRTLPAGATVAGVLRAMDVASPARGIAVAVDGEVVRHADWDSAVLSEGARVEVLGAIGGGR